MRSEQPLIVVERDEASFERAIAELEERGWRLRRGWDVEAPRPLDHRLWGFAGAVRARDEAEAALRLALAGAAIVVSVDGTHGQAASFIDDLGRIGRVDIRGGAPRRDDLDQVGRVLLRLLSDGRTIADAALELHVSLRTANRRLAEARKALGAASTAEAVRIGRSRGLC